MMKDSMSRAKIMYFFWNDWVSKYRSNWLLAFSLHLSFFALSAMIPYIFKGVIDSLADGDIKIMSYWIVGYIIAEGVQILLLYSRGYSGRLLEMKVERDLKTAMYIKFFAANYLSATQYKSGEAIQRVTSDVENTRPLIVESFAELIGHVVLLAIIIVLMFVLSPYLAITAIFFVCIYAIGFRIYQKRAPKFARDRQVAQAEFIATLEEGLDANYSVRVQGSHKKLMNFFANSLNNFLTKGFSFYRFNLKFQGIFSSAINYLNSIAVLIIGAWLVTKGLATIGTIIAFSQYVNWLVVFVNFMSSYAAGIEPAIVSYKRIDEVLEIKGKTENQVPETMGIEQKNENVAIEVRNLNYSFGSTKIYQDFNLIVPAGKITMIKAASGRGKSTLFNILLKLYPVEENTVFVFGEDINKLNQKDILSQIAVVEQEPKFFGSSILDYIATSDDFSIEALVDKSGELGLKNVFDRLFNNSSVSSKLKDLSGGERKRLGILRGLLKEKPIILMDGPTAFIDEIAAKNILEKSRKAFPHATFLIISHDSSMEDLADLVIKL